MSFSQCKHQARDWEKEWVCVCIKETEAIKLGQGNINRCKLE